jgi:hypothetical protein
MITRAILTLVFVSALFAAIGGERARAQAEVAGDVEGGRSHFDRGVEYVEDGDLRGAMIEFKRAYAMSPNYRVLYNLGQVCNELREYTESQRYLQRYLADGGAEIEPARRREVEATLGKLTGRIATLLISSNIEGAELFVDNVSVGKAPLSEPVRVSVGTRMIAAAVSGKPRVTQVVEAAGGDTLAVRLDFSANAHEEIHPSQHSAAGSQKSDGPGPVLWLGIGTGVLGAGAGVMAYLASRDAAHYHDAVHRKTTARELDQLDQRATTKALITDILLGATIVAAGTTLVFALKGGSQETAPNHGMSAHLSLGPGSLQLAGRFE